MQTCNKKLKFLKSNYLLQIMKNFQLIKYCTNISTNIYMHFLPLIHLPTDGSSCLADAGVDLDLPFPLLEVEEGTLCSLSLFPIVSENSDVIGHPLISTPLLVSKPLKISNTPSVAWYNFLGDMAIGGLVLLTIGLSLSSNNSFCPNPDNKRLSTNSFDRIVAISIRQEFTCPALPLFPPLSPGKLKLLLGWKLTTLSCGSDRKLTTLSSGSDRGLLLVRFPKELLIITGLMDCPPNRLLWLLEDNGRDCTTACTTGDEVVSAIITDSKYFSEPRRVSCISSLLTSFTAPELNGRAIFCWELFFFFPLGEWSMGTNLGGMRCRKWSPVDPPPITHFANRWSENLQLR